MVALLMPALLALQLVDDLGLEAMTLGPPEVHPQQHLGPVGRLGAAGARADGDDGVGLVVVAARTGAPVAAARSHAASAACSSSTPGGHLLVAGLRGQLGELDEVAGARQQRPATWSGPRAAPRPRGGPSGPPAGRPRTRARPSWRRAPRGAASRPARSKPPRGRRRSGRRGRGWTGCPSSSSLAGPGAAWVGAPGS